MTHIRREIVIAVVEDIETETIGIEVTVPDGMTTLEAIGLIEIGKQQHLQSKHNQGPTVHQTPTAEPVSTRPWECKLVRQHNPATDPCDCRVTQFCAMGRSLDDPAADSCTCTIAGPGTDCPVHHGRKARRPKPPNPPGCNCDGSGRACPRHGAVL